MLDLVPVIGPHTTHLQTAVIANAKQKRTTWWRRMAIPLTALGLGLFSMTMAGGFFQRPIIRQPAVRGAEAVKTEADIGKQFFRALMSNKPMEWRAIETKFPPDRNDPINISYNLKGWLQYAWTSLELDRLEESAEAADKALEYCPPTIMLFVF